MDLEKEEKTAEDEKSIFLMVCLYFHILWQGGEGTESLVHISHKFK